MGQRLLDQEVFIASDFNKPTTSSNYHSLSIDGDTIRLCNERAVTLTATGNPGEICYRGITILGVTTYYLCICVAPNQWRGTALSGLPI